MTVKEALKEYKKARIQASSYSLDYDAARKNINSIDKEILEKKVVKIHEGIEKVIIHI